MLVHNIYVILCIHVKLFAIFTSAFCNLQWFCDKAAGVDNIVKEHLTHSHPALIVHLKLLFNIMSVHGFVPDGFGIGIIIPIVKDNMGDITDANRHYTVSSHIEAI